MLANLSLHDKGVLLSQETQLGKDNGNGMLTTGLSQTRHSKRLGLSAEEARTCTASTTTIEVPTFLELECPKIKPTSSSFELGSLIIADCSLNRSESLEYVRLYECMKHVSGAVSVQDAANRSADLICNCQQWISSQIQGFQALYELRDNHEAKVLFPQLGDYWQQPLLAGCCGASTAFESSAVLFSVGSYVITLMVLLTCCSAMAAIFTYEQVHLPTQRHSVQIQADVHLYIRILAIRTNTTLAN